MDGGNGAFDDGRGPHQNAFIAGQQPLPTGMKFRTMQADPNQLISMTYKTNAENCQENGHPIGMAERNRPTKEKTQSNHVTVIYGAGMPPANKQYYTREYERMNRENEEGDPDFKKKQAVWGQYSQGMCFLTGAIFAGLLYWIYTGQSIGLY